MLSLNFWKAALERAVKTGAQTAVAILGGNAINVVDIAWLDLSGLAAGATLISILTSIASMPLSKSGPSLIAAETIKDKAA